MSLRWLLLVLLTGLLRVAQAAAPGPGGLHFVENKRQWPAAVRFRASLPGGAVYLSRTGLVYDWVNSADLAAAHDAAAAHGGRPAQDATVRGHAVFVDFVDAAAEPVGEAPSPIYHNYFLGNDPTHWAGHVRLFGQVRYPALYPGVALELRGTEAGQLKYEFVVAPGASPGRIGLRYRGAAGLSLRPDGTLRVRTSVGSITEQRPYAYQLDASGQRREVPCRYRLESGAVLRYELPAGFDSTRALVIDPVVMAATYSGANCLDAFGSTATYDAAGNLLVASMVTSGGYPVRPGAYQYILAGLSDVGLSKFNADGSVLRWATYLGGNSHDIVRSLRTTPSGDVYVYAETSSVTFPTTPGCYDNTYSGPTTDLTLSRLRADGAVLLGSTYLGGNTDEVAADIALDATGNVVAVGTTSGGFPTTAGAFSQNFGGITDGFVARLNPLLTTLSWSTLLGGSAGDRISSVQVARNGDVVVAGGTNSGNFPLTTGVVQPAVRIPGDAFVARLRADGAALVAASAFGVVNGVDAIEFVALDAADNPYVYGTTTGSLAATPGAVTNAIGRVFLSKLAADLRSVSFTALVPPYAIGTETWKGLTALGVDVCGRIHAAALVNTTGLPVVNPLPGGGSGGLHVFTLSPDGTRLEFASGYGPYTPVGGSHAHSAIHRFDDQGRLYHAICINQYLSYRTTPGAYAPTSLGPGYDTIGLKIGDDENVAVLAVNLSTTPPFCAPQTVRFTSTGVNVSAYTWNFGDNSPPETGSSPSHTYAQPGTYRVRLTVSGPPRAGTCAALPPQQDTLSTVVTVAPSPVNVLPATVQLCGGSTTLDAGNAGSTYQWSTGATTRAISVGTAGTYSVLISTGSCRLTSTVRVDGPPTTDVATADTTTCAPEVQLRVRVAPGSTVRWSTQETTPSITVTQSGTYSVQISRAGCTQTLTRRVSVGEPPQPPNVITPNGDGDNDVFVPTALEPGTRLLIFNRWGRLVYRSDEYRNDWQASGQAAGMYYYLLENERFCFRRLKG